MVSKNYLTQSIKKVLDFQEKWKFESMKCPNCGTYNPEEANFCFNCSHNLIDIKPQSKEERFTKYIPPALMNKLEESAKLGGIENERRIVTILFCDVVGSTEFAEQVDPEDWAEIISEAFDFIIPPIYKYEGILARLMGDAMLAFFGAPISHEDDPERAILASLDIMDAVKECSHEIKAKWGFDIDVRIGINTGLVVVGEIGSDMRVEYTAMGDAINVASRMESTAEPGCIQITQNTFKHVSYLFQVEKLGKMNVKGKSEPISTYKILGKKSVVDRDKKYASQKSVFVEREKELYTLNTLLEEVKNEKGKICWIRGEAGIGKSRLVKEFYNSLFIEDQVNGINDQFNPSSDKIYWLETEALPFQLSSPYSPIINFFHEYFGISIDMENDKKYNLIKKGLEKFPNGEDIFPYITNLLQVELSKEEAYQLAFLDPVILQEITLQSIVSFLEVFSQDNPLILVFDDIQWADRSTLVLMKNLIKLVKSGPIFLIILSRIEVPSYDELMEVINSTMKDDFHLIELNHLSQFGSSSLISNLLKVDNLPNDVRETIVAKSQGNPFYVEELVNSLIESGDLVKENEKWSLKTEISKLHIPDTLMSLLTTRLDQLDEKSKRVAQSASVIGREFLYPILQCINDPTIPLNESIQNLENRDWIVERIAESDKSYLFKHVLSRDVAYNSLLIKRRKEIHRKIAYCLKEIDEGLDDEIARHFFEAEIFDEAFRFILKAAENAISKNSTSEAISMLSKIEQNADKVGDFDTLMATFLVMGTAYAMEGNIEESTKYYNSLLDKSKNFDDRRGEVRALNKLAENAIHLDHNIQKADELLDQAEVIGNLIDFPEGLMETSAIRCVMHQSMGEFDKAAKYETKGVGLTTEIGEKNMAVSFKYNLIVSHILSLKIKEGEALIEEFLNEYEPAGEKYFVSSVYGYIRSILFLLQSEVTKAYESAIKGYNIAREIKAPMPIYFAARTLGEIHLMQGEFQKAMDYFEICINESTKNTTFGFVATSKFTLALCKAITGEYDEGLVREGLGDLEKPNGTFWGSRSWGELGYLYLQQEDYSQSRKYFDLALSEINAAYYFTKPYNFVGKIRLCIKEKKYEEAKLLLKNLSDYNKNNFVTVYEAHELFLSGLIYFDENKIQEAISKLLEAEQISNKLDFKHLRLEILSYLVKSFKKLDQDSLSIEYKSQLDQLADEMVNQFKMENRKLGYLNSIAELINV